MRTTQRFIAVCAAIASLGSAEMAWAQDAEASAESGPVYERGGLVGTGLVLGLKGAMGLGQVYDSTELAWIGELELGWVTPHRPLEIFVTGSYLRTGRDEAFTGDARLPADGGAWSYDFVQDNFIVTLGGLYRIPLPIDIVRPYGALGGRAYMSRTEITGYSGAQTYGTYEETGTAWGLYAALGADFFVGPGSILFEVQTGWAPVNRFVQQETSTGTLNFALGYRIFL